MTLSTAPLPHAETKVPVGSPSTPLMQLRTNSAARKVLNKRLILNCLATVVLCIAAGWNAVLDQPVAFVTNLLAAVGLVAAGTAVMRAPGSRQLGYSLMASGVLWGFQWVTTWNTGIWPIVGIEANAVVYIIIGQAILHYPDGHRTTRWNYVAFIFLFALIPDRVVLIALSDAQWWGFGSTVWWPHWDISETSYDYVKRTVYLFESLIAIVWTFALWNHVKSIRGIDNILTKPVALAICAVGILAATLASSDPFPQSTITDYFVVHAVVLLGVPLSFFVVALRRNWEHADIVRKLSHEFAVSPPSVELVRDALRRTLSEPTLDVFYWRAAASAYVGTDGKPADLEAQQSRRFTRSVATRANEPLAVVCASPSLARHAELVDTALNASSIALENARLHATVLSQLNEVQQSRARVAEAAFAERRRLERDIHDGVQQRLLAVSVRLGAAKQAAMDSHTRELFAHASEELHSSLELLRDLAHGIHPPELRQFGLNAAVMTVIERLRTPTTVCVTAERFSDSIEAASYFVICEALTNVTKHAQATAAHVEITRRNDWLRIEVSDNGIGGARVDGSGLTGLADRVEAFGGTLNVISNNDGTTLEALFPCA